MDYNNRIKELLKKRGIENEKEMEDFLNPSLAGFYSPFLLFNMDKATARINKAIQEKQKIVIYGDYDADGICAVSMLNLFFKKKGVDVNGFIPSRHHDGYGITKKTVGFITNHYKPNLVITVDTGISAKEEIKEFNALGVDTIVTDHHEPPKEIPEGIVIDPKIEGQPYPFNGLSGAGVALKLIQALAGVEESLEYIDICAISTIGDIVPLIDENRLITKLGLEKINAKKARPSIAYLKSKLNMDKLSSTDIAFKVVPRLNACGRMTTAEKCFHYLCETRTPRLEKIYQEMEEDNNLRLYESNLIMGRIYEHIKALNFNEEPAIFIVDKEINLGLIGIIASKLCAETNRPVFIFTEDEEGRLKASIRSISGVNIFNILDNYRDMLVDVGGHSLAGGLTILKENYEKFKSLIMQELKKVPASIFRNQEEFMYDQEISPEDINLEFAKELEKLEPYGFMNPKPVFKLKSDKNQIIPLKSFKHYKIKVTGNKDIVSFFGSKFIPVLESNETQKNLLVNIEVDTFLSRPRAKAILKNIEVESLSFNNSEDLSLAKHIYYYATSIGEECKYVKYNNINEISHKINSDAHTLIITDSKLWAENLSKTYDKQIVYAVPASGETSILYNPTRTIEEDELKLYHDLIFVGSLINSEAVKGINKSITILECEEANNRLKVTRDSFKVTYTKVLKSLPISGNNIMEVVIKLGKNLNIKASEVMLTIMVSSELGFINIDYTDGVTISRNTNPAKRDLTESKTYSYFLNR